VELVGVLTILIGWPLGLVDNGFALQFAVVAIGYGIVLSLAAVAVEEFSFRYYRRWIDLLRIVVASLIENVGYRQLHAWWRLVGLGQALRGGAHDWGAMERRGFSSAGRPL
jgi:hypothetical protein